MKFTFTLGCGLAGFGLGILKVGFVGLTGFGGKGAGKFLLGGLTLVLIFERFRPALPLFIIFYYGIRARLFRLLDPAKFVFEPLRSLNGERDGLWA